MNARLVPAAVLALAGLPVGVAAVPSAQAADACTPTIAMSKPYQDPGGFVVFPASYSVCDSTRVTIKYRDRDTDDGWGLGSSTVPAGSSGTTSSGTCAPDGQAHRWVAYATLKVPVGGQLLAKSAKVYFKAKPVVGNCAPWPSEG